MLGWHFTKGMRLRDGTPLEAGRLYIVTGPLIMCERGLHASVRAIDALRYAPGCMLSRVELGGELLTDTDKACATERRVLWCADATRTLREFAIIVATEALEYVEARGCRDAVYTAVAAVAARHKRQGAMNEILTTMLESLAPA